jgi:Mlc titration factor MtfA (ptsG expression regulator)
MSFLFIAATTYLVIIAYRINKRFFIFIRPSKLEFEQLHRYFLGRFRFYNQLPVKKQRKFINRIHIVRQKNKIKVDEKIVHVYKDIELMVAAAFVQITFGFSNFEIKRFSKIVIYPDSFYSKLAGDHVNGLTVGNGFIYMSWNHFLQGYSDHSDKINLALHELAHALYIDKFHYKGKLDWFNWEEEALPVFKQLKNNDELSFFRDYAKTNMAEFWAVCVECFFEDPANFRKEYPYLYHATARVLKQDLLL